MDLQVKYTLGHLRKTATRVREVGNRVEDAATLVYPTRVCRRAFSHGQSEALQDIRQGGPTTGCSPIGEVMVEPCFKASIQELKSEARHGPVGAEVRHVSLHILHGQSSQSNNGYCLQQLRSTEDATKSLRPPPGRILVVGPYILVKVRRVISLNFN